jgi:hypothetical protein
MYKMTIWLALLLFSFSACKKDVALESDRPDNSANFSGKLSYETDQWSIFRTANEADKSQLTNRELAMFQPVHRRNKVDVTLHKDGTVRWVLEELPVTPLVQHNTLPDPRPPKVKTIIENGVITHLDKEGNVLRTFETDMQPFDDLLVSVFDPKANVQSLLSTQTNVTTVAGERDERFVKTTEIDPITNYKKEYLVDTEKELVVETKIFDETNQLKNKTRMDYDMCLLNELDKPTLQRIRASSGGQNPESAIEIINEITTEIMNLNFEDYLN